MRRSTARTPRVAHRPDLGNEKMEKSIKLQFRHNQSLRSNNLLSRPSKQHPKSNNGLVYFVVATLALALCLYLFVTNHRTSERRFGIVIDAGSTGTRIHVFEFPVRDGAPVFDFGEKGLVSMRVQPGLSSYAKDPEKAGGSLAELVEFGRKRVPKEEWGKTEVRLMATAGLRMLDASSQERIMESCRRVLSVSGFKFRDDWASIISGSDEGVYAWVAANYALGTLGGDPQETTGIIELGGASTQVTFVSSEQIPPEFSRKVTFGNFSYNLYSHSLLQFGQNVAFDLIQESLSARGQNLESIGSTKLFDPCTPKGFKRNLIYDKPSPSSLLEAHKYQTVLHSSGNFSECRSASLMFLQKGKVGCPYTQCDLGSTFIPKLRGKFLATENFFHTSKFFGLAPRAFLFELMVAGQQFCGEDWSSLKKKYQSLDVENLHHFCFSSAYIVALLHDSLGIGLDDERIAYANQVNKIPLDWALGAFILQTTDSNAGHLSWISSTIGEDPSALLALLLFFLLLLFSGYIISKWRKPQEKTIYDLEKGKYIITRIGRYS